MLCLLVTHQMFRFSNVNAKKFIYRNYIILIDNACFKSLEYQTGQEETSYSFGVLHCHTKGKRYSK